MMNPSIPRPRDYFRLFLGSGLEVVSLVFVLQGLSAVLFFIENSVAQFGQSR
jgi:hypothetical protein